MPPAAWRRYTAAVPAFAGIDLAWTRHHDSGVCIVRGEPGHFELVSHFAGITPVESLIETLVALGPDVVAAIDAPLVVGPGRTAEREVGRAFSKYRASAHSANHDLLRREGRDAGPRLAEALTAEGFVLDPVTVTRHAPGRFAFEVYPHALHVCWFELDQRIPYKRKGGRSVASCREALGTLQRHLGESLAIIAPELLAPLAADLDPEAPARAKGSGLKQLEDRLDALTCVIAAMRAWRDGMAPGDVLGEGLTGYVAVPGLALDCRFGAVHPLGCRHAHEAKDAREADLRRLYQP